MKFRSKLVSVFGPPGSGKTNFVKSVFSKPQYSRHLIFDPMKEYEPEAFNVYRPKGRRYDDGGNDELNAVADKMIVGQKHASVRPAYFVVDEGNRTMPNGKDPGPAIADLVDFNRHFEPGISFWSLSRRPAQINSDIENLANHTFVFGGKGKNDRSAYDNIHVDLTDALDEKEEYEAVYVSGNGELSVFEPVENFGETSTI